MVLREGAEGEGRVGTSARKICVLSQYTRHPPSHHPQGDLTCNEEGAARVRRAAGVESPLPPGIGPPSSPSFVLHLQIPPTFPASPGGQEQTAKQAASGAVGRREL